MPEGGGDSDTGENVFSTYGGANTHVAPERAEDMVDEMLAIQSDRDFWVDKKKSEYYQQQYNQMLWEEKNR